MKGGMRPLPNTNSSTIRRSLLTPPPELNLVTKVGSVETEEVEARRIDDGQRRGTRGQRRRLRVSRSDSFDGEDEGVTEELLW